MKPNLNPSPNPSAMGSGNNQTKPNQTQTTPVTRGRGGIDRGRMAVTPTVSADERPPLRERLAAEYAWVNQHLPDEHPDMAVAALGSLKFAGASVTVGTVRARLRATGRDCVAVNVLAARYGTEGLP